MTYFRLFARFNSPQSILLAALLLVALGILVGCGEDSPAEQKQGAETDSEQAQQKTENNLGTVTVAKDQSEIQKKAIENNQQYLKAIEELEQQAKETTDQDKLFAIYGAMAALHEKNLNYKPAVDLLLKVAALHEEEKRFSLASKSYNKIAYLYMMEKGSKEAAIYYDKSIKSLLKTTNEADLAYAYHNLGQAYIQGEDYENASGALQEALAIHLRLGNEDSAVQALNSLGITHRSVGDFENALFFYAEALNINIKNDNEGRIAEDYLNIGAVYHLMGDGKNGCRSLAEGMRLINKPDLDYKGNKVFLRKQYTDLLSEVECEGNIGSFAM